MKHLKIVELNKTNGKDFIYQADEIFKGYLSDKFKNYTDKQKPTKAVKLDISEMDRDGTFKDLFTCPEKQFLTQSQIIEFVKNYKHDLRQDGYATFLLFKEKDEFFVASVSFDVLGRFLVSVYQFSYDFVWFAKYRLRLGSLQLDSKTLKNQTLKPLETLPLTLIINGATYVKK